METKKMSNPIDIAKERSPFNWAQIISLISGVAFATWILSGIYFEFKTHETEMNVLRKRIEYIDSRIDKKFTPLNDQIKELQGYHKK